MELNKWLELHRSQLGSDYEVLFVKKVLPLVTELDVRALHAQYHFVDCDGRNRYCDFAILEGDDVKIAIEADGYNKDNNPSGPTCDQFVDWQRRQNSLISQGWTLARFANRDIRDHPKRCADHIGLLLRNARSKQSHHRKLEAKIQELEKLGRPQVAEDRATYGTHPHTHATKAAPSSEELVWLRQLLQKARLTTELSEQERERLRQFEILQKNVVSLTKETNTMKTTIWAMAALIAFVVGLLVLTRSQNTPLPAQSAIEAGRSANAATEPASATPAAAWPAAAAASLPQNSAPTSVPQDMVTSTIGTSCDLPLPWQQAQNHIGTTAAIVGPVARVTDRPDVKGQPTFITVGLPFPSRSRVDVVIWGNRRTQFTDVLQQELQGRSACFFGEINERDGIPQMIIRERGQLQPM